MKPGNFLFLLALGVIVACGTDKGSRKDPATEPSLQGYHFSGCYQSGDLYKRNELSVALKNYMMTTREFQRSDCAQPTLTSHVIARIDQDAPSARVFGAQELDISVVAVTLYLSDAAIAGVWNEQNVCGYHDWEAGVSKDVTGRTCAGVAMPKYGERRFNLYHLRNDGTLFMGRFNGASDGKTPQGRPEEVDLDKPFAHAAS